MPDLRERVQTRRRLGWLFGMCTPVQQTRLVAAALKGQAIHTSITHSDPHKKDLGWMASYNGVGLPETLITNLFVHAPGRYTIRIYAAEVARRISTRVLETLVCLEVDFRRERPEALEGKRNASNDA